MPVDHGRTAARAAPIARIRDDIAPVLTELRRTAGRRDADREHPFDEVRQLAEAGVVSYRIPRADGGAGATVRELAELLVDLGAADSNVPQLLRASILEAEGIATGAVTGARRARSLERLLAGDLFAGSANEAGGASGAASTRIVDAGGALRVEGQKYYSTGGLHARWISGSAIDESGSLVTFTVPTDREGVVLLDDFDAVGQRLTASGTTLYDSVPLEPDEIAEPTTERPHPYGSPGHLILAATLAGIAEAARDDAVRLVRDVVRPIKHAGVARSADDPYVRIAVGRIATAAFTARAQVIAAADALDAYWRTRDEALAVPAVLAVASAYAGAAEQALRASELAFDVGGGTLTRRDHNLDRHWRNARTVANHNPRAWKTAAIGAWLVADVAPPANGLF